MSIQWTFVFFVLMAELFIITPMLIPLITPAMWVAALSNKGVRAVIRWLDAYHVPNVIGALVVLLFLDSVRETLKYSFATDEDMYFTDEPHLVRLYRAQRNMYMSAFALYLMPVFLRLIVLIIFEVPAPERQQALPLPPAQA